MVKGPETSKSTGNPFAFNCLHACSPSEILPVVKSASGKCNILCNDRNGYSEIYESISPLYFTIPPKASASTVCPKGGRQKCRSVQFVLPLPVFRFRFVFHKK